MSVCISDYVEADSDLWCEWLKQVIERSINQMLMLEGGLSMGILHTNFGKNSQADMQLGLLLPTMADEALQRAIWTGL